MTVQWSTTLRNALLDQWGTSIGASAILRIYTGSQPANCAASPSGTLLAEFDFASTWTSAASGGSKSISGTPLTTTGLAAGNAGHYRIYASDGATCHEQGSITATGGGGDA